MVGDRRRGIAGWVLLALTIEKIVQHCFVTWAFATNSFDIRDTVVVDHRWLIAIGGPAALLFAVAAAGLFAWRQWSLYLLVALALVDIVGEFIAQGTIGILITVSFLVAIVILVLALVQLRHRDDHTKRTGELSRHSL